MRSLDTETCLIAPGIAFPPLVCTSDCDGSETTVRKWDEPDLVPFLASCFEREDLVFANAPFDLGVFMRHDKRLVRPIFKALAEDRIFDVQMNARLNDLQEGTYLWDEDEEGNFSRKSYSLDAIGNRLLGVGKDVHGWKYRARFHNLRHIPLDQWDPGAVEYASVDADLTLDIKDKQPDHGDETFQVRAHVGLSLASARGFRTDNDQVLKLRNQCEEWIAKLEPELKECQLVRKNGKKNTKQAVRRMIESTVARIEDAGNTDIADRVVDSLSLTTTGERVLIEEFEGDADAFLEEAWKAGKWVSVSSTACMEVHDPVLLRYGVHSKISNMLNGTVKHVEEGTFLPIETYFDPLKETGRTSSSGPNIQNVRQGIDMPHPYLWTPESPDQRLRFHPDPRECFVAREGYVLLASDYTGAESATLAQVCKTRFGFSAMADAINSGKNLHNWVGATILRTTYEDFVGRYKRGDEDAARARQFAKVANFGFPGGCGAARLVSAAIAMGIPMDEYEAVKLKRDWLDAFPEMVLYFDYIAQCEAENGYYYVDHLFTKRVRGRATFTAACNSHFQGLASDAAKAALFEITRRQWCCPESALYGTYIVNFVHDEFILEVPIAKLEAATRELNAVMVECFNQYTPDVPMSVEADAGFHWKKKMYPVFGKYKEEGTKLKLIPGTEDEFGWNPDHVLAA